MNDEGREVLRRAALDGHRQAYYSLHDDDADCALGVLHLAAHRNREEAVTCDGMHNDSMDLEEYPCRAIQRFKVSWEEQSEIIWRNDAARQDFLTIATKTGIEPIDPGATSV